MFHESAWSRLKESDIFMDLSKPSILFDQYNFVITKV